MRRQAGGSGSGSGGGICRRERGSGGGAIRCGREHTQGCKTRAKERTNLEGSPLSSLPSSSSSSKTTTLTIPTPSPGLKVDVVCGGVTTLLPTEPAIGHAKNQTLATPEKRSRALFFPPPLLQPLPPQLESVSKTKAAPSPSSASTTFYARKRLWISSHAAKVYERRWFLLLVPETGSNFRDALLLLFLLASLREVVVGEDDKGKEERLFSAN